MRYQVMQQFIKGPELQVSQFTHLPEALKFIKEKMAVDASMKINTTYRIYEFGDLVDEWTADRWKKEASAEVETSGGSSPGGAGQQSGFRPTPLATSPRPPGMPPSSFRGEDIDRDKDK